MSASDFPMEKAGMQCKRHSLSSRVQAGLGEESGLKAGSAPGDPGIGGNAAPLSRESGKGCYFDHGYRLFLIRLAHARHIHGAQLVGVGPQPFADSFERGIEE